MTWRLFVNDARTRPSLIQITVMQNMNETEALPRRPLTSNQPRPSFTCFAWLKPNLHDAAMSRRWPNCALTRRAVFDLQLAEARKVSVFGLALCRLSAVLRRGSHVQIISQRTPNASEASVGMTAAGPSHHR
jgi:hypothetical protein